MLCHACEWLGLAPLAARLHARERSRLNSLTVPCRSPPLHFPPSLPPDGLAERVVGRVGELQVTVWPQSPDMFGLASGCKTVDDIVCCADSEHIRNEWLDVFHRLGIDIASKLGADDEDHHQYDEEQQARSRRAEHCAVPATLCDTADEKGLKRGVAACTSARTPPPRLFASIPRSALNSPSPCTRSSQI